MVHCAACGRARKHGHSLKHITPRGRWCKKCRIRGDWDTCYCGLCGGYRCVQHGDTDVMKWCQEHPYPGQHIEEVFDEDDYGDEDDYDESVDLRESHGRELAPHDEGYPEDRSRVSSRNTRHQCDICKKWFDFEDELEDHQEENDYGMGCKKCQECFPESGIYNHALDNRHDRCFVEGCRDKYARVSGWTDREVEEHVYESHSKRHKPPMQPQRVRFSSGAHTMGAPVRNRR